MAKITGRSDDMLIIRGVNVFPTQIEELILKQATLAPHYYLEVTREGHLDSITVNVELAPGLAHSQAQCVEASRGLARSIKVYIGITAAVLVHPANTLERSAGKAKRIVDKRESG